MAFKKKVTNTPVVETTEQVVAKAVDKLKVDVDRLAAMKDTALSAFRSTANNLASINEQLNGKVNTINDLIKFATEDKANAEKMIADNEAVCKKILDIIGE